MSFSHHFVDRIFLSLYFRKVAHEDDANGILGFIRVELNKL